ncbi:hypothetical protein LC613_32695 [Nostoc sphaeroides CHAB 2801]|uniref:Uncharacterized protein n=1 Tax=Nostoc sphaeroides CCNUC1 TaxID=2653204 RepID=A0A5P8WCD2_9NOSO|nr:hypothetical protein [Nostoc sphaeroides]MCC5632393.1 hypothetical protein [Nostoc sphaeroides CHAB 2801]QFS50398.1 hypothetical protein GXM_07892 [Nostoc sphaeroides CCNUC1]
MTLTLRKYQVLIKQFFVSNNTYNSDLFDQSTATAEIVTHKLNFGSK